MVKDIPVGVGWNEVRCGVIGEIGVTGMPKGPGRAKVGPITPDEEKVLRAAARAARRTAPRYWCTLTPFRHSARKRRSTSWRTSICRTTA